jgi:hypothetical protein
LANRKHYEKRKGEQNQQSSDIRNEPDLSYDDEPDADPSYDYEPEPEPEPVKTGKPAVSPLPPPTQPERDYLAEAVVHKNAILELFQMMRPIERKQFLIVLTEDVEKMERTLNEAAP